MVAGGRGDERRTLAGLGQAQRGVERAADAIRFAIEELPPDLLLRAQLKVDEKQFDGDGMRQLYESAEYPLVRRDANSWARTRSQ